MLYWIIIKRLILLCYTNIWNIHIQILYFDWMISVYFLLTFHSKFWQRVTLPAWNDFPWELNLWNIFSCFIFIYFRNIYLPAGVSAVNIARSWLWKRQWPMKLPQRSVCGFFFFNVQGPCQWNYPKFVLRHILAHNLG